MVVNMSTLILIKNKIKFKFVQSYEILRFIKNYFVHFLDPFVKIHNKKRLPMQQCREKRSYI